MLRAFTNFLKTYLILPRYVKGSTVAKLRPLIIGVMLLYIFEVMTTLLF
jgi:hypothetical protein